MNQLTIYADGTAKLGLHHEGLIAVDIENMRNTTQLNPNFVPHDFIDGFYWDMKPMVEEEPDGKYLIVDDDFFVHYKCNLLEEDINAINSDSDELDEYFGATALIDLEANKYWDFGSTSWKDIL